eukprot:jgi/Botrbrau1/2581/Bobra.145_1s0009.1
MEAGLMPCRHGTLRSRRALVTSQQTAWKFWTTPLLAFLCLIWFPQPILCGRLMPSEPSDLISSHTEELMDLGTTNAGGSSRDPLVHGFDGVPFSFRGTPGRIYNLVSTANGFRLTAKLRGIERNAGRTHDYQGSCIESVGFQEGDIRIALRGNTSKCDDGAAACASPLVAEINKAVQTFEGKLETRVFHHLWGGTVQLQERIPDESNTTEIIIATPLVRVKISSGYHMGRPQPCLSIEMDLLSIPSASLHGIIGDTYHFKNETLASGRTVEATERLQLPERFPEGLMQLLYPVFPIRLYEIPHMFAPQATTVPSHVIHDLIGTRKMMLRSLASKLAPIEQTSE